MKDHFIEEYINQACMTAMGLDRTALSGLLEALVALKSRGGRLFVLGVGGSASNASHAVGDFRTLAGIQSYTPSDNVAGLTAKINDEGWEHAFSGWLSESRLSADDAILVLSVGGGSEHPPVSKCLVGAIHLARERGARVLGIVGRDGGATAQLGDDVVVIRGLHPELTTPLTEAFQAVIWHMLVSHPTLRENPARWEGLVASGQAQPARPSKSDSRAPESK